MSIAHQNRGQGIPKMMIQNALRNRLRSHAYKIQILDEIKDKYHYTRAEFANLMLSASDDIDNFFTAGDVHKQHVTNKWSCKQA
jgi:hypothetical protein